MIPAIHGGDVDECIILLVISGRDPPPSLVGMYNTLVQLRVAADSAWSLLYEYNSSAATT